MSNVIMPAYLQITCGILLAAILFAFLIGVVMQVWQSFLQLRMIRRLDRDTKRFRADSLRRLRMAEIFETEKRGVVQ